MPTRKPHDPTSQFAHGSEPCDPTIAKSADEWGQDCLNEFEGEFAKRAAELPLNANESALRTCMCSAVLSVLIDKGFSGDDLADVLTAQPFRSAVLDSLLSGASSKLDNVADWTGHFERDTMDSIDRLYEELAALNSRRADSPDDAELREKIRAGVDRLRQLQQQEASDIEAHFLRNLSLPIGESEKLLHDANELVRKYANTSRSVDASEKPDGSAP